MLPNQKLFFSNSCQYSKSVIEGFKRRMIAVGITLGQHILPMEPFLPCITLIIIGQIYHTSTQATLKKCL